MDKRGVPSLIALAVHVLGFLTYLILLYGNIWVAVYLKACIYLFISAILIFIIIDEWHGFDNDTQWQCNTINKCVFASNFILSALTVFNKFDGVLMMGLYCFAIGITSVFILTSGLHRGYFKRNIN